MEQIGKIQLFARNQLAGTGPSLLIASVYRCPVQFRSIARCTKSFAKESHELMVMSDWTRLVMDGSGVGLSISFSASSSSSEQEADEDISTV